MESWDRFWLVAGCAVAGGMVGSLVTALVMALMAVASRADRGSDGKG